MKKALCFVLIVILVLGFTSCKKGKEKAKVSMEAEWTKYISAHTSGVVARKSRIRVVFVNEVGRPGEIPTGALKISPPAEGKLQWANPRMLTLTPSTELEPDTEYTAMLYLNKIMRVPKEFSKFVFSFRTIKPQMELNIEGLYAEDYTRRELQVLKGIILTSDMEDSALVEKVLQAEQLDTRLIITWSHSVDGLSHYFTINKVVRQEKPSVVRLHWDGSPIKLKDKGVREVEVPPLAQFDLTSVTAVLEETPHILLRFTDAVGRSQDLSGLITVGDLPLTFEIEGNMIRVYSRTGFKGEVKVRISPGIKSHLERTFDREEIQTLVFGIPSPQVRFVGQGVILPRKDRLTVPIEAINLKSVQVTVFQVFTQNIPQFLQVNELAGGRELARVGRYLWRKTIALSEDPEVSSRWTRYELDVTPIFQEKAGTIYRIILSFNRNNTTYPCPEITAPAATEPALRNQDDAISEYYYWDETYAYPYIEGGWFRRNDPCSDAYYNPNYNRNAVSARNFLFSNLGLVAKLEKEANLHLVVTDLRTAQPLSGVKLEVFNFQHQPMGTVSTDGNGFAVFNLKERPFLVVARTSDDIGYLRLSGDSALSLSSFDIGGEAVKKGIKGFIYGERGVWRPSDKIFLTFVLFDRGQKLPVDHPVVMEIYSPQGQLVATLKPKKSLGNFHAFEFRTDDKAQTGSWQARVLVGGLTFSKTVRIETVVPNRLKIDFKTGREVLATKDLPLVANLSSQWLHGAPASNLNFDVTVRLASARTVFSQYPDYVFDDPSKSFSGGDVLTEKGVLDLQGNSSVKLDFSSDKSAPGMLEATFVTRVFEESGDFSLDTFTLPFHPYGYYVGLSVPKGYKGYGYLETDQDHALRIITVDTSGAAVSRTRIKVSLYKIGWRWWWEREGENLADYLSSSYINPITSDVLSTENGHASWKLKIKYPDWGRFLVRVEDLDSGHSSGQIVYVDWPYWAGRSLAEGAEAAARLTISSDKQNYHAGERATIYLPETVQGRALVSVESGSAVFQKMWVSTRKGENRFEIQLTEKMTPNVYVHVTLIQPHSSKVSDTPIRMYGVIPLMVEDPATRLEPVLNVPQEIKPKEKFKLEVSEKNRRHMVYTLAVVDEGLLALTRYSVPDLRKEFYKREALGVTTWDLFDQVAEAYSAELGRILALGGDEFEEAIEAAKKPQRFPPVVLFDGPFELKPGETATHELMMPQYFGSVRVMVVAGEKEAFGSAEKSVYVRRDLMALPTLPRVVRPGEQVTMPITVFVTNPSLKEVEVALETNGFFQVMGEKKKPVRFAAPGDQIINFDLKTVDSVGQGKVSFEVRSGSEQIRDTVYIEVLNANPYLTQVTPLEIKPGQTIKQKVVPFGVRGTNEVIVEASPLPDLQLEKRVDFLIQYPHGCLEQTLSIVFPQLYLKNLVRLSPSQQNDVENHIRTAISKMGSFQLPNGAFSYWPGMYYAHFWTTVYAGWFLLEASRQGYYVPAAMLGAWKANQKILANSWTTGSNLEQLTQAFRLFALAQAQEPDLGAMNRLRERQDLGSTATVLLAAAFYLSSQREGAADLVNKTKLEVNNYRDLSETFGSELRDKALVAHCLSLMQMREKAEPLVKEIAEVIGSSQWLSTNETAMVLLALSSFYGTAGIEPYEYSLAWDSESPEKIQSTMLLEKRTYPDFPVEGRTLVLTNSSQDSLYVNVYTRGTPPAGKEEASARGLEVKVTYRDLKMNPIDITSVSQGSDLLIDITVQNRTGRDLQNLALTQLVASGFQIKNPLFSTDGHAVKNFDYQDVRDDRIYTYFGLRLGETKTFMAALNASYLGQYYQPGVLVETMYDNSIQANTIGQWLKIIR